MNEPTEVLLKAIRNACSQDEFLDGFFRGFFDKYSIKDAVNSLDQNSRSVAILLNSIYSCIVEYDVNTGEGNTGEATGEATGEEKIGENIIDIKEGIKTPKTSKKDEREQEELNKLEDSPFMKETEPSSVVDLGEIKEKIEETKQGKKK